MNKRTKQYIDLTLKLQEELYDNVDKESKEIYRKQKRDLEDTLTKIAKVILTYKVVDNILDLKLIDKSRLKNDFNKDINRVVKSQYNYEKDLMNDILINTTKDKYYTNGYVLNLGIDFNLKKLSDKQIKEVVNSALKGDVWSNRLWKNKRLLEKDLKIEINRLLNGKTDINKVEKLIENKFSQNAYNSKRLIHTEVSKCQSEINEIFAQEHRVIKQMFMATLDNRTSQICQRYDSQVFKMDDFNKPIPPLHPRCRSVLVNMPSNDWKPSIRKDNIAKEYANYSTYQEWKENNV